MAKIVATANTTFIKKTEVSTTRPSGIYVPTRDEQIQQGVVVASERFLPGTNVLYLTNSGFEVTVNEEMLIVLYNDKILGALSDG